MRALSIVSLLLVFISCIITIVNNVKAVNYYMAHRTKEDEQVDCDYIECVPDAILPSFRMSSKNTPALTCFHSQG